MPLSSLAPLRIQALRFMWLLPITVGNGGPKQLAGIFWFIVLERVSIIERGCRGCFVKFYTI
jgi:hypothetical protein